MYINIAKLDFYKISRDKFITLSKVDFGKIGGGQPPQPETGGIYFTPYEGVSETVLSYDYSNYYNLHNKYLKISTNGVKWTDWTSNQTITSGNRLYVKGLDNYFSDGSKSISFDSTAPFEAYGDIGSLIAYNTILPEYCFDGLFYQCSNLKRLPDINYTEISEGAFYSAFRQTGITEVPDAFTSNITTVGESGFYDAFLSCEDLTYIGSFDNLTIIDDEGCYEMFNECGSLITGPQHFNPSYVGSYGCESMFADCSAMTKCMTELHTTHIGESAFEQMFENCSSLTKAPELVIDGEIESWGAFYMFSACTSLTEINGELNVTAESSYNGMFEGCSSLTKVPELNATTLADDCYNSMFYDCESLNEITLNGDFNTSVASYWVDGVAESGTFYNNSGIDIPIGVNGIPVGWTEIKPIDYMYFKLADGEESGGISYEVDEYYNEHEDYLKYSTDGNNWTDWTDAIDMLPNVKYYVKGESDYIRNLNTYSSGFFSTADRVECGGNIMSLISAEDENEIKTSYCFSRLFRSSSIISAPKMTAKTISGTYCCQYMFQNCTSLTEAPELPATDIANRCYYYMFAGCSNLTKAPSILPATNIGTYCYAYMFQNCTSLTEAPSEISSNTISNYGCSFMFNGCTSLTKAPELPAKTVVAQGCGHMFDGCTSLTEAPELPATNIGTYCYTYMFRNCTNLTKAPSILPGKSLQNYCYSYMFNNCQKLVEAPELPATGLVGNYCMRDMFGSCYKLNWIKALFTSMTAPTYTNGWVQGVSAQGVFVKNINATWEATGANAVPPEWTIIYFDITDGKYYTTKTKEVECDKYGNPLGARMKFLKKPTDVGIYWDPDYVELPDDSDIIDSDAEI